MKLKLMSAFNDEMMAKLTTDELRAEIAERKKLLGMMCGSLYPSILEDEIARIYTYMEKA